MAVVDRAIARAVGAPGSMTAIIGPCGAGKTTATRSALEKLPSGVKVIQVDVPQKEDLSIGAIMDTMIQGLGETPKRTQQARTEQFKRVLGEQTGRERRVLLVIDEAHALPLRTIKGLKRLLELTFALRLNGLFSVALVGQSELRGRLRLAPEANKRCRRVEMAGMGQREAVNLVAQVAEHEGLKLDESCVEEIARRAALPLDLVQIVTELAEWAEERGVTKMDVGMVMHALGETRKRLMAEYGITVAEIAAASGVSKATVSAALSGNYGGKRTTVQAVEEGLADLVAERRDKNPAPAMAVVKA